MFLRAACSIAVPALKGANNDLAGIYEGFAAGNVRLERQKVPFLLRTLETGHFLSWSRLLSDDLANSFEYDVELTVVLGLKCEDLFFEFVV